MRKNVFPSFSSGQFAQLMNTSKRTLFHYDKIGLFSPEYISSTGYRYYSERQCDTFVVITFLKELGIPLVEIKALIDERNPQNLETLFWEKCQIITQEIERLQRVKKMMQTKIELFHQARSLPESSFNHVTIEHCPAEHLIVSQRLDSNDPQQVIPTIYAHVDYSYRQGYNEGHPYGAMIAKDSLQQGAYDTYAYFFTKIHQAISDSYYRLKPGGIYAVIYLQGDYHDSADSYEKLLSYINEHGYLMSDYSYKEGILDEVAVHDNTQYITKISIALR